MQRDLPDAFVALNFAAPVESAAAVFYDGGGDFPAASAAAEQVAAADAWRSLVAKSPVSSQGAEFLRSLAKVGTLLRVHEILGRRVLDVGATWGWSGGDGAGGGMLEKTTIL